MRGAGCRYLWCRYLGVEVPVRNLGQSKRTKLSLHLPVAIECAPVRLRSSIRHAPAAIALCPNGAMGNVCAPTCAQTSALCRERFVRLRLGASFPLIGAW